MSTQDSSIRPGLPVPRLTEVGVTGFFVAAGLALLLRPELDPVTRYISEYAVGERGWIMRTGFVLLGVASLNLVAGFLGRDPFDGEGRTTGVLVGVWALAVLVAAAFGVDPQGASRTPGGLVHLLASFVAFVSLLVAMVRSRRLFRHHPAWRPAVRPTGWLAAATLLSFVLEGSLFSSLGWVGVGQWPLFVSAGIWLVLVARRFAGSH